MDLHNNSVGQEIGEKNPLATADELAQKVEEQRKAGSLVVIKDPTDETGNSSIVPSNKQNTTVFLRDNIGTIIPEQPTRTDQDNTKVVTPPRIMPEKVTQ